MNALDEKVNGGYKLVKLGDLKELRNILDRLLTGTKE